MFNKLLTFLAFIFVLGIAVFFHEFGHFVTAKISGIKVFRFSLGFGPKIAGFSWKETEYVLSLFPFGGYVKMAGEESGTDKEKEGLIPEEDIPEEQRFDKKPFFTRVSVIVNGPLMNIILALLLFAIVFYFSGTAKISNTISEVAEGSPAAIAGIKSKDQILFIDSIQIENPEEISEIISKNKSKPLTITIMRNNHPFEIFLVPEYNEEYDRAMIGITLEVKTKKLSVLGSMKESVNMTGQVVQLIWEGFAEMIAGTMPVELAGPLGIAQMAGEAAKVGFLNLLFFTAVINIFLGIINLFPIPILDGGQIVLLAIEKIRGKPLNPEHVNFLYIIGITFVVLIFLIATYQDISRFFIE